MQRSQIIKTAQNNDKNVTKIAAIQMASGPQIKANLMEAARLIREAAQKGAQLIVCQKLLP